MRILLVEDNDDLADAIVRRMGRQGHAVDRQSSGEHTAGLLRYQKFDLLILDIGLPHVDGMSLLRSLRNRSDTTPVLMLTARDGIEDRVSALDSGADDYVGKPFDFRELEARCRMLLRRNREQASGTLRIGCFSVDYAARKVMLDGDQIDLPNREYSLLEILAGRLNKVVYREKIGNSLFGFDDTAGPNAIELYVARLRKKLAGAPVRIITVRGVGYMLEEAGDNHQLTN